MKTLVDDRRVLEIFMNHSTSLTLEQVVSHFIARHPPSATANSKEIVATTREQIERKIKVCKTAGLLLEIPVFDIDAGNDVLRYTITPRGCNFLSHR